MQNCNSTYAFEMIRKLIVDEKVCLKKLLLVQFCCVEHGYVWFVSFLIFERFQTLIYIKKWKSTQQALNELSLNISLKRNKRGNKV